MQIITGKYRARKLVSIAESSTRPTLAKVKESVFNMIQNYIEGSIVLDLFAGSGAFGIECISRGSSQVYFVDSEKKATDVIKLNTRNMQEEFFIINKNFENALRDFSKQNLKFDLIYLDPPYKSNFYIPALNLLEALNLLSDNAIIIAEHGDKNDLQNIPKCYIIEKSKKYGTVFVDIMSYKK